jgi:hypothetical protein
MLRQSPRRLLWGAFIAICSWETPSLARDREALRLIYATPIDTTCPDEASFRNLVAARLGYDPFATASPDEVHVELTRDHGRLRGRIEITRAGQTSSSARELVGDQDKCEALGAALATTLAIALDPMRSFASVPAPVTEPPPIVIMQVAPSPPSVQPLRFVSPGAHSPGFAVFGVASGTVAAAEAPTATFGGDAAFGLRFRALSIEATGRVESTPGAVRVASGDRLQATILSGGIVPCLNVGAWSGCASARLGAFQGYAPDVIHPSLGTTVFASLGARLGYSLALSPVLALRPTVEVAVPLVRTSLVIDKTPVWMAPPATIGVGLGLVVRFM